MEIILIGIVIFALIILSRFKVIRQNERGIIEKGGRFKRISLPGIVFVLPFEKLYTINVAEAVIKITDHPVITKDNITCKVTANVHYKISDVNESIKKLFYEDYKNAIEDHVKAELFETFGTYLLKQISTNKLKIIATVRNSSINISHHYTITDMEIKNITLPEDIQKSIERSVEKAMERETSLREVESEKLKAKELANIQKETLENQMNQKRLQADSERRRIEALAKTETEAIGLINEAINKGVTESYSKVKRVYESAANEAIKKIKGNND